MMPTARHRSYLHDRGAGVLIIAALLLPVAIGIAALVLEYGNGLLVRAENQRVSDLASYSGAIAYSATNLEPSMRAAVRATAALNGISADKLTISLVDSPKGGGVKAVNVRIATPESLFLSRVLSDRATLTVVAESFAQVGALAQPVACMLALDAAGTGITLSGGTKLTANNCDIASNATVSVPCGTKITTATLKYNSAAVPSQPCAGIVTPAGTATPLVKTATPDPFLGNAAIAAATARLTTVAAMSAPATPSPPAGGNISFAWDQTATKNQAIAVGCTAVWTATGSKWTLNCGTKPTINFGSITVGGGISVDFHVDSAASTVFNFKGSINNTGSVMRFGAGVYNIAKGVVTGGGTTTSFKAGTFRIGRSNINCNGGLWSVCNTASLTFEGPSVFELPGGITSTGNLPLAFGSGTANSFRIGPANTGYAINVAGGATVSLGDATTGGGVFQIKGHVLTGGGSCLMMSASAQHDIAGNFSAAGGVVAGAGVYTIDGYFALGANGGGNVTCGGESVSLKALDVSLILSGKQTPSGGSCKGFVFCVAAGYSGVKLTSPTTGATAKLAVIGPQSAAITGGATFAEGGANASISGAFYFPKGPVVMNGGASAMGAGAGQCLQLVATRITLSGGTAGASECVQSAGSGGGGKVSLVQ